MSSRPGQQLDRRAFARRTVGLCFAALLNACATPSSTVVVAPTAPIAPATLLLWHGWSGMARQILSQQIERFNRQNSAGQIILQSVPLANFAAELRAAAMAGSGPHLAIVPSTWVGTPATGRKTRHSEAWSIAPTTPPPSCN